MWYASCLAIPQLLELQNAIYLTFESNAYTLVEIIPMPVNISKVRLAAGYYI